MSLAVSSFGPLITSTTGQQNHYMTTRVTEGNVAEQRGATEAFRSSVAAQAPVTRPDAPPPAPALPKANQAGISA